MTKCLIVLTNWSRLSEQFYSPKLVEISTGAGVAFGSTTSSSKLHAAPRRQYLNAIDLRRGGLPSRRVTTARALVLPFLGGAAHRSKTLRICQNSIFLLYFNILSRVIRQENRPDAIEKIAIRKRHVFCDTDSMKIGCFYDFLRIRSGMIYYEASLNIATTRLAIFSMSAEGSADINRTNLLTGNGKLIRINLSRLAAI